MRWKWQSYGTGRDTGVRAYALAPESIALRFHDGATYLYNADLPGRDAVQHMQALARRGTGLTTFVNQAVRGRYAQKLPRGPAGQKRPGG